MHGDRDRRTGRAVANVSALGMLERIFLKRGRGVYIGLHSLTLQVITKLIFVGYDCTRVCSREF